jgi:F0F1-type ATP synthase epsilon subunit
MADDKKTPEATEEKTAEAKANLSKEDKKAAKDEFDATTNIHVKLYSPYQVYYDGEAESVSAENDTGPFDVLPRHHNFITLLNPCEVEIKAKTGDKRIKIARGVMHVHRNNVTIFLDV